MDVSDKFVEMCKKEKEVQELCKFEEGDIIYIRKGAMFQYNDELGGGQLEERLIVMVKNSIGGRYYGYARKSYGFEVGSVFSEDEHGRYYKLEDVVWLPRQDQLQNIIFEYLIKGNDMYSIFSLLLDFVDYANRLTELDSMEQLWLAFVMKELYSKQWLTDKQEWVKI